MYMKDEYFLLLDTSTEVCSVALGNRDEIVDYEETQGSNKHAEQLADIAARMLSKIDYKRDLKGVGVSNGPGSYTGLRIGASYAKGLCWTLGIPLVSVMTTELLAMTIFDMEDELDYPNALLMPMIDARRMEVYTAIYTGSYDDHYFGVVEPLTDIAAVVLTDEQSQARLQEIVGDKLLYYFGNGAEKAKGIFDTILPGSHLIYDLHPRADAMLGSVVKRISLGQTEDVAYWEPYYLKEYEAKKSVNKVLSRILGKS